MTDSQIRFSSVAFQGSSNSFRQVETVLQAPDGHDLLVRILAVSVNPVDLKVRQAKTGLDDSLHVLGWDATAIVERVGHKVEGFKPGERIWYAGQINRAGSNAEYQLVDARIVSRAPGNLDDSESAAMPLTLLTAWEALFDRLGYQLWPVEAGKKRLLIINGAGGVGSVAIQLASLAGIEVTATASRAESQQWCRDLGASHVLPHNELTGMAADQFDRILCCHDTDRYFEEMVRLVAPYGLICALSSTTKDHNLKPLMAKSAGFVWEYMFTPGLYQSHLMARQQQILSQGATLFEQGKLKPTLTQRLRGMSPENLEKAHRLVETGKLMGKLVIQA